MTFQTDSFLLSYHHQKLHRVKDRLKDEDDDGFPSSSIDFFRYLVPFLQYNIPYGMIRTLVIDDAKIYDKTAREFDPIEESFSQSFDFYDKYGDYPKYFERAMKENWSMLFFGANESGKTFTSLYFLAQVVEAGYSGYYIPFQEFLFCHNRANFKSREESERLLEHLYSCDLLVVDEVGKESSTTDNVKSAFERLIKRREQLSYPTIFCGNVRFKKKKQEQTTFQQKYKYSVFNALMRHYRFFQFSKNNELRQRTRRDDWTFDDS